MAELEAAEDAAEAAAREARRTIREKRKAELNAGVEERVGKLKEKLHVVLTTRRLPLVEARRPQGRRA